MLIEKKSKHKKWDNDWRKIVKQGTQVLNDTDKANKVDEYTKGGEEINTLQTALAEKETQLKTVKNSITNTKDAINNEKAHFAPGGKKTGWKATFDAFKDGDWQTNGWINKVKAHYPTDYIDNLYLIDNKKITEDQVTKILARVVYEIGRLDRADFVANHGLTATSDPTATIAEELFDQIAQCSKEIEAINTNLAKDKDGKEIGKKTWDLPFTYSKEQKVDNTGKNTTNPIQSRYNEATSLERTALAQNIQTFVDLVLTDEVVAKLKPHNVTQKEDKFEIYQAGDAYDDETLKNFGIEVSDNNLTTLYRSNLKFDETTKSWKQTDKLPINIQDGLKDWIKLFKSVFAAKEICQRFEKGLPATDPNYLLFSDLRRQAGTEDHFISNGKAYRLYENAESLKDLELEFILKQDEKAKTALQLQAEVDQEKRNITKKTAENKKLRLAVAKIAEEILEKKKEALKAFELEKGFDGDNVRNWITLKKIQKLILEIRYLQNDGDATKECALETEAGDPHHIKGLVGIGTTDGTLDTRLKNHGGLYEDFYLVKYLTCVVAWDATKHHGGVDIAIKNIKDDKDDLLVGIEFKEKLELYHKHFEGLEKEIGLNPEELAYFNAIKKELGKDTDETIQGWRTVLGTVDSSLNDATLITDTWKDGWTALGDKFKKVDDIKTLLNSVKDKPDFITQAKAVNTAWTSLKEIIKEEPKKVIGVVALYDYEKLDDSAKEEKDKKKTQMKRRLAVKLGKKKESEITDQEIADNLIKIRTGELTFTTTELAKCYNASLQEITTKKPQEEQPPFLRWNNPRMYVAGAAAIVILGAIIFWDKVMAWFDKPADEQGKDDNEEDDD